MIDLIEIYDHPRTGLQPDAVTPNPSTSPCDLYVKVDARTILPAKLADAANFLQHRILTNLVFYHKDENIRGVVHRYTALKAVYLQTVIPVRIWKDLIDQAQSIGLIERSNYIIGTKCFGYRIGDRFANNHTIIVQPVGNRIRRKIMATRKTRQEHRIRDKTYRHLLNWVGQIEIPPTEWDDIKRLGYARHLTDGDDHLSQAEYFSYIDTQLQAVQRGQHHFGVDDYGRVQSTTCSLVRAARARITIQGQPLVEIDIKNSQPVFLTELLLTQFIQKPTLELQSSRFDRVIVSDYRLDTSIGMHIVSVGRVESGENDEEKLKRTLSEIHIPTSLYPAQRIPTHQGIISLYPPDLIHWKSLVENGTLYDYLMGLLGWTEDRRDEFKQNEIFAVLYGNPNRNQAWMDDNWKLHPASKLKPILAEHFPTVWAFLIFYHNEHGHGSLARELQRKESQLMIRGVCGTLADQYPFVPVLTCHDAILTTQANVDLIQGLILAEFDRRELHPTLKTTATVPSNRSTMTA